MLVEISGVEDAGELGASILPVGTQIAVKLVQGLELCI